MSRTAQSVVDKSGLVDLDKPAEPNKVATPVEVYANKEQLQSACDALVTLRKRMGTPATRIIGQLVFGTEAVAPIDLPDAIASLVADLEAVAALCPRFMASSNTHVVYGSQQVNGPRAFQAQFGADAILKRAMG